MRVHIGKKVGKTYIGASVKGSNFALVMLLYYCIVGPFYLLYYVFIWPWVALYRHNKKKKAATTPRSAQPSSRSSVSRYSYPAQTLEAPAPVQTATYEIIKPTSKKALNSIFDSGYVVLDVETTGLSPKNCDIIELGMLYCQNGHIQQYSSLFNPGVEIPRKVQMLTGITNDDVATAPKIEDCLGDILAFIGDSPLVAHNARFDMSFLADVLSREGISAHFIVYDTLEMARRAWPNMQNHKLTTLVDALELSPEYQAHNALEDAVCTQKLFALCVDTLLDKRESELAARRQRKTTAQAPAPQSPESDSDFSDLSWLDLPDF